MWVLLASPYSESYSKTRPGDEPKNFQGYQERYFEDNSRAQKAAAAVELNIEDKKEDEDKEDEDVEEDVEVSIISLFVPMPFRRHRLRVLRHAISSTLV